jgi:hypothetical protein
MSSNYPNSGRVMRTSLTPRFNNNTNTLASAVTQKNQDTTTYTGFVSPGLKAKNGLGNYDGTFLANKDQGSLFVCTPK